MELEIYKMKYRNDKDVDNLRILGEDFVKNNRNKGKLIINNKKYPLKTFISSNIAFQNKIKIGLCKNIYNKSCMYKNCELLEFLSLLSIKENKKKKNANNENHIDFKKEEKIDLLNANNNIGDDSSYFYDEYTSTFSQIINKKEENSEESESIILYLQYNFVYSGDNYAILKEIFYNCKSLTSLPDISEWNIKNIIDISCLFYNCELFSSFPVLQNWILKMLLI